MRFSVDAHAIGQHLTGNEVYVRNLLNGFAALDQTSEFVAYLSGQDASAQIPKRFATRQVSSNPFLRLGFELTQCLRDDRPDLLHVQYTAPLACAAPIVVSVHDVSFLEHPEWFPWLRSRQLRLTVRRTVRRASRVLTPSEFSARSIAASYRAEEKTVVIPNAVSSAFRPVPRASAAGWVRERFGIPAPFVLSVGDLQPRKNQAGLIRAFEELLRDSPQLPHHLVLVGKETWYAGRVRRAAAASACAGRIHFTGFVGDDELLQLYGACDLFVFPSFYEGFGLPILEAMACGRAVACSNTTAMPEVADAAALLFDPRSTTEMTRAMKDLLVDAELRARIERLGAQRSAAFSWENTARKTLAVYYEVAEGHARVAKAVSAAPVL
ncbi:MAG: glycosyltransferase family 4 protein [Acidobacteria bacterium]|nr:glycosyltransferase family 4 protein [Acidobacteriota bacterium]